MALQTGPSFMGSMSGGGNTLSGKVQRQKAQPRKAATGNAFVRPPQSQGPVASSGPVNRPMFGAGMTTPGNEGMQDAFANNAPVRSWMPQNGGFTGGMDKTYQESPAPVKDNPQPTRVMQSMGGGIGRGPSSIGGMNRGIFGFGTGKPTGPGTGASSMVGGVAVPYGNPMDFYKTLMLRGYDIMDPNTFSDMQGLSNRLGY